MRNQHIIGRSLTVTATAGVLSLAVAAPAFAHVSVQPEQAAKGDHAKLAFRVPNERDNAGTVKVKVSFPTEHPISSVSTTPVPGWKAEVEKGKLDKPVEMDGTRVTEAVRSVTWTAEGDTRIAPDQFDEFEVSVGLPTNTDQLVLPATQTYESGEVVKWNQPPTDSGEEPDKPAPVLTLAEGEGGHSHGGGSASDSGHDDASQAESGAETDNTARWLGGAGLVVGALGLGLGGGALLRGRKGSSS